MWKSHADFVMNTVLFLRIRRSFFIIFILFLCFSSFLNAQTFKTVYLSNGAKAYLYIPSHFDPKKKYPVLMALHGMGQSAQSALTAWKKVAETYHYILICPQGSDFKEGYVREPIDDRKRFIEFHDWLKSHYKINQADSVIAGFSRGGNVAIEAALLYPNRFPKAICIFGFFNQAYCQPLLEKPYSGVKKASFYFITGKGDLTETSLKNGQTQLQNKGISCKIHVFSSLFHAYPPDLVGEMKKIRSWWES